MITVTEIAAEKIREVMAKEEKPGLGLRVYVEGGGCAGMQYGLIFENEKKDGDEVQEQNGFNIIVDRFSAPYLTGITIDYVTSLQGAGFKIDNPNSSGSCGCGQSFKA